MTTTSSTSSLPSTDSFSHRALQIPEILDNIAYFLSIKKTYLIEASLVCKYWSIIFTARVWRTLDYPPLHSPAFNASLRKYGSSVRSLEHIGRINLELIFEALPQLRSLSLTLVKSFNLDTLHDMVLSFPQLRSLSINCCNEQDLKWLSILKGLCFLEGFTFTSDDFSIRYRKYDFSSENVENHSLASESDYSTGEDDEEEDIIELELGFHGAEEVEDEDHSQDSEYEALEFATSEISDGDLSEMNDMDHLGDFLVARASTLKKLNMEGEKLGGFILFENWRKTEDSDSTNILLPNPSIPLLGLTELNISKTYILQPQHVVEPLLLQCPNLEKLNISSNFDRNWYRFNWSILHTSCLKLTSLNISEIEFIDNDQLVLVIKKCLGLCSLIAFNSNVSDIVLGAIMERQITMAAENIEDSEQKQETKPFLELDISWCMKISQRAIEKFLQQISSLEILKISWCSRIDLTIFQSQWACLNLKILEAQGLENPSIFKGTLERTMFEKISQFEYLERLVIGSNEVEISVAKGFDLIGNEGLPHLEHLELLGREENPFEPPELTVLKKGFPKLKRFHFGMGLVTPDHQDWLRRIRPDMKVEEDEVYF